MQVDNFEILYSSFLSLEDDKSRTPVQCRNAVEIILGLLLCNIYSVCSKLDTISVYKHIIQTSLGFQFRINCLLYCLFLFFLTC